MCVPSECASQGSVGGALPTTTTSETSTYEVIIWPARVIAKLLVSRLSIRTHPAIHSFVKLAGTETCVSRCYNQSEIYNCTHNNKPFLYYFK